MLIRMPPKKRKLWQDSDMLAAMEKVEEGVPVSAAARMFNVPRRTLDDRMKGHVSHGTLPGPSTVLSKEQEDALMTYLVYMAEHGFPLTRKMVMAFAWAIALRSGASERFSQNGPSNHWWLNFKRRHPNLTLRKVDTLDRSRAQSLNADVIKEYFDLLGKVLTENDLLSSPRQIYNCDETYLPLNESKEKAVTVKSAKSTYCQSTGSTEHITMLCGVSASGAALPPMIIYPRSFPGGQYRFGGPDDCVYSKSESGWVDSDLFLQWFKKVFLKYAVQERPLLLLVDGHKSHETLELIDLARSNNVILLCLPAHTTHALQPLDVAVFKSLKAYFSRSLRTCCFTKKDFIVTKRDFARVVKEPFEMAFSISNIKSGFRKCGIYPVDRHAIQSSKVLPSEMYRSLSESETDKAASDISTISTSAHVSEIIVTSGASITSGESVLPLSSTSVGGASSSSLVSSQTTSGSEFVQQSSSTSAPPMLFSQTASAEGESLKQASLISNPLVLAGLVPGNLADILAIPTVSEKPKRRVTKTRVFTEQEYYDFLKQKDQKEKEAQKLKEQRKQERQEKKALKARQRLLKEEEREKSRKGSEFLKRRRQRRKKAKPPLMSCNGQDNGGPAHSDKVHFPSSTDDSDGDQSDTVCTRCNRREPEGCQDDNVFWVDCDSCDRWFHMKCVFGSNGSETSGGLICEDCLP